MSRVNRPRTLCECGSGQPINTGCAGWVWCPLCKDGSRGRPSVAAVQSGEVAPRPSGLSEQIRARGEASRIVSNTPRGMTAPVQAAERRTPRPARTGGTMTTTVRPPSPASLNYVRSLLAGREGIPEAEAIRTVLNEARANGNLSQSLVSSSIDALTKIARPRASQPRPGQPTAERNIGDVHVHEGRYYRIHESQRTGGQYACVFDPATGRFEYAKGAIRLCTPANKATAEQAATFGHLYHQCVFCARRLDTPESTAVGYGPVCAENHGLPWG